MKNKSDINVWALVGFIVSVFVWPVGVPMCIFALYQIKKTGENGKLFAIAGIVYAVIRFLILIIGLLLIKNVIWPEIENNVRKLIFDVGICTYGESSQVGEPGELGYVKCGEAEGGTFSCEFYVNGVSRTISCDVE